MQTNAKHYENHPYSVMWIALAEYFLISTHLPVFQSFFIFFVLAKLTTTHILTLMLLVANVANTNWCKTPDKWLKPWQWMKVTSASEGLTITKLRLLLFKAQGCKHFWKHLNTVMLVFIGKLLLSSLRWILLCRGFNHFSVFFIILYW